MVTKKNVAECDGCCVLYETAAAKQRETQRRPFSASGSSTKCREATKWLLYICFWQGDEKTGPASNATARSHVVHSSKCLGEDAFGIPRVFVLFTFCTNSSVLVCVISLSVFSSDQHTAHTKKRFLGALQSAYMLRMPRHRGFR